MLGQSPDARTKCSTQSGFALSRLVTLENIRAPRETVFREVVAPSTSGWKIGSSGTAWPPALLRAVPQGAATGDLPALPPTPLPRLGHFQLPGPSPPLGLSALRKSRQAEQEQDESCDIRHSVTVYDATSRSPGTCRGADPPGRTTDSVCRFGTVLLQGAARAWLPGWFSRLDIW